MHLANCRSLTSPTDSSDEAKIQGRGDHLVPLSAQALDVLHEARARFGRQPHVFPHTTKSQDVLCQHAVGTLINRAGYAGRHSAHGWRSAFSTVMNDRNPADADIIEAALAHQKRDQVAGRYNRGTYFERRRVLMQTWADLLLDGMPDAATICAGRKRSPLIVSPMRDAA
jgi:integrase